MSVEITLNLPADEYRARPGVSHSMLEKMEPTPANLKAYLDSKEAEEPTEAMVMGTLIHAAILEPEKPWPAIAVKTCDYRTPEGKAWKSEQEAAGKIILGRDAFETLNGCVLSAARHSTVQEIFAEGESEVSAFAPVPYRDNVLRKCRFDWIPTGNAIADIKTVNDASPQAFSKNLVERQWASKAAFYLDLANAVGLEKDFFIYIAIEKHPPYLCALYQCDEDSIAFGRRKYTDKLLQYIKCIETGIWPGYSPEIQSIGLPAWASKQIAA